MDLYEAILERHSVRQFTEQKIEGETLSKLETLLKECNEQSNLNMQLIVNKPEAFSGFLPRLTKFANAENYFAVIGEKDSGLEERCGYIGELLVLRAQQLGLNTCWVSGTYKKRKVAAEIKDNEKLVAVIAVGYGENSGAEHKGKALEELYKVNGSAPNWFLKAMKAVALAPSALNKQNVLFEYFEDRNKIKATARGIGSKLNLGIAKCHFAIAAQGHDWSWL